MLSILATWQDRFKWTQLVLTAAADYAAMGVSSKSNLDDVAERGSVGNSDLNQIAVQVSRMAKTMERTVELLSTKTVATAKNPVNL